MGVVYQARDPRIDRSLALKVLRSDYATTDSSVNRFLKEAKAIGRLSHPNIVTIFDVENEGGDIFIAMEYLEGTPLSDLLRENRLQTEEVLQLGIQIAETLDYAHERGVIHRDIKPSNIIVEQSGRVKITDFGIARIENSSETMKTQAGEILGTPAYMSPEQALGETVDGRSDIFSVGVMLYEMITGERPFGGERKTLASVLNDIIVNMPPAPHTLSPFIPRNLSELIIKALQKKPDQRFQSGKELAEALKACLRAEGSGRKRKIRPEAVYEKRLVALFLAVTVIFLFGGTYLLYRHFHKESIQPAVKSEKALTPKALPAPPVPEPKIEPPPKPVEEAIEKKEPAPVQPEQAAKEVAPKETVRPAPPAVTEKSLPPEIAESPRPTVEAPEKEKTAPATPPTAPPASTREKKPKEVVSRETEPRKKPPTTESKPIAAALVPLTLKTVPSGAGIYVDGTLKGSTPKTIMLSIGEHRIRLSLPGYREIEKQVTMEETMEYPLSFQLTPLGGPGD